MFNCKSKNTNSLQRIVVLHFVKTPAHYLSYMVLLLFSVLNVHHVSVGPGAFFSKVPKNFQARKAICEPTDRLFRKAELLTCFEDNKKQNDREV